jgi:hypothetical protein
MDLFRAACARLARIFLFFFLSFFSVNLVTASLTSVALKGVAEGSKEKMGRLTAEDVEIEDKVVGAIIAIAKTPDMAIRAENRTSSTSLLLSCAQAHHKDFHSDT